jgi:transposase
VALLNPLRTHPFAGEALQRTKTDAIDALGIARFAAQKRPPATRLPDAVTQELRELVRVASKARKPTFMAKSILNDDTWGRESFC